MLQPYTHWEKPRTQAIRTLCSHSFPSGYELGVAPPQMDRGWQGGCVLVACCNDDSSRKWFLCNDEWPSFKQMSEVETSNWAFYAELIPSYLRHPMDTPFWAFASHTKKLNNRWVMHSMVGKLWIHSWLYSTGLDLISWFEVPAFWLYS